MDQLRASSFQEQRARFGLALTLGGGEVRLLDLTAAYAAFANGGSRVAPVCHQPGRDTRWRGAVRRFSTFNANVQRANALDPRVAYLITDILGDETARIPGVRAGQLAGDRPAGRGQDRHDHRLARQLDPRLHARSGGRRLGGQRRQHAHEGRQRHHRRRADLARLHGDDLAGCSAAGVLPAGGLVQVEVCADSGLLPGSASRGAEAQGSIEARKQTPLPPSSSAPLPVACPARRLEWFIAGTEPTQVDNSHVQVALDVRTGQPAGTDTAGRIRSDRKLLAAAAGVPGVGAGERRAAARCEFRVERCHVKRGNVERSTCNSPAPIPTGFTGSTPACRSTHSRCR